MPTIIKLATINIDAITNRTRIGELTEYIRRHDLDIIFLQEITDPELLQMSGYDVYYNIGSDIRGRAIVARNCVLDSADTSGHFHTSRAVTVMTRGLQLKDTWKQDQNRAVYTHYSNTGASRIDRIYVSHDIAPRITGTDFLSAAFTDHKAVVVHLALGDMGMRKRLPRWKLDPPCSAMKNLEINSDNNGQDGRHKDHGTQT
jgi:endonuclease/exonuclease/phosphatase family metal-dependent hydrolase